MAQRTPRRRCRSPLPPVVSSADNDARHGCDGPGGWERSTEHKPTQDGARCGGAALEKGGALEKEGDAVEASAVVACVHPWGKKMSPYFF